MSDAYGVTTSDIVVTPSSVIPLTPANSATGVSFNPLLSWTTFTGATRYELTFGTNPAGTNYTDAYGWVGYAYPVTTSGIAYNNL